MYSDMIIQSLFLPKSKCSQFLLGKNETNSSASVRKTTTTTTTTARLASIICGSHLVGVSLQAYLLIYLATNVNAVAVKVHLITKLLLKLFKLFIKYISQNHVQIQEFLSGVVVGSSPN